MATCACLSSQTLCRTRSPQHFRRPFRDCNDPNHTRDDENITATTRPSRVIGVSAGVAASSAGSSASRDRACAWERALSSTAYLTLDLPELPKNIAVWSKRSAGVAAADNTGIERNQDEAARMERLFFRFRAPPYDRLGKNQSAAAVRSRTGTCAVLTLMVKLADSCLQTWKPRFALVSLPWRSPGLSSHFPGEYVGTCRLLVGEREERSPRACEASGG